MVTSRCRPGTLPTIAFANRFLPRGIGRCRLANFCRSSERMRSSKHELSKRKCIANSATIPPEPFQSRLSSKSHESRPGTLGLFSFTRRLGENSERFDRRCFRSSSPCYVVLDRTLRLKFTIFFETPLTLRRIKLRILGMGVAGACTLAVCNAAYFVAAYAVTWLLVLRVPSGTRRSYLPKNNAQQILPHFSLLRPRNSHSPLLYFLWRLGVTSDCPQESKPHRRDFTSRRPWGSPTQAARRRSSCASWELCC